MTIIHRPAFGWCTTTIHHCQDVPGLREVTDASAGVSVLTFPFDAIARVVACRLLEHFAAYALCGKSSAYIGETGRAGGRLLKHAADPTKAFATEVYVLMATGPGRFDRDAVLFLQKALTEQAEAAGHVTVIKGAAPRSVDLSEAHLAILTRQLLDGYRLMFDAGCRAFHSNHPAKATDVETDRAPVDADVTDDPGIIEIGVERIPPGAPERELNYVGIRARGYELDDGFIVAAGSEIRTSVNPSARKIVRKRQHRLIAEHALLPIDNVDIRMRFAVSVTFASAAIAADVVCGAHVNGKLWKPVKRPVPVIVAA